MPDPRVSAVIAVYNAERYIQQALLSLTNQTLRDLEIIVVDDGSTDQTNVLIRDVQHRDNRVRLYTRRHSGAVDAFNFGARQARGEYLAWLGADDVALPTRLRRQVDLLDAQPSIAVVGSDMLAFDEARRTRLVVRYPSRDRQIRAGLRFDNLIAAPSATMRRRVYLEVGGCRSAFRDGAEDYDLWLRIAERHDLANVPEVLLAYRVHAAQVSRARTQHVVVCTVGAQLAARRRAAGGSVDGLDSADQITLETLRALEPDPRVVKSGLLRAATTQSMFLALLGAPADAHNVLTWAETVVRGTPLDRRTRARAALARAMADWIAGDRGRAVRSGVAAGWLSPSLVAGMFARGGRTWLERGRRQLGTRAPD